MIRLSKRILFSIKAVLDIACHGGESSSVRSIDITEREGIPTRYLEPVLQQMVREGILVGNLMIAHTSDAERDRSSAFISINQMLAQAFRLGDRRDDRKTGRVADPTLGAAGVVGAVAWFFIISRDCRGCSLVSLGDRLTSIRRATLE